jgi:hypothetical protein
MTEASLDALFEAETHQEDRCFFTTLPPDVQEWVRTKHGDAKAAGKLPPWAAIARTLAKAGYTGALNQHAIDYHFNRDHERS